MQKIIFWSIIILCVWIISPFPITAEEKQRNPTFNDLLTPEEKVRFDELVARGLVHEQNRKRSIREIMTAEELRRFDDLVDRGFITERNVDAFMHRFLGAPDRATAFDFAFTDPSFGKNAAAELHAIKRAFADPQIGFEALKKYYQEHGAVIGTLQIALSPVTIPMQSWDKIIGEEKGLGEYPLKVLIGAAVVLLWGRLFLSKQTKQTKYNYKVALSRLTITISITVFIVYSIIDGVVSGLTFVLYAALFLGMQYLIIWILYYAILWGYRYVVLPVILWIYSGLKQPH